MKAPLAKILHYDSRYIFSSFIFPLVFYLFFAVFYVIFTPIVLVYFPLHFASFSLSLILSHPLLLPVLLFLPLQSLLPSFFGFATPVTAPISDYGITNKLFV